VTVSRASEFSTKVRLAAFKRCNGLCEECGAKLKVGEGEYDHVIPLALGGESIIENCQVLCVPCHRGAGAKTSKDVAAIARAKRREIKHVGAAAPKQPIHSRGFDKKAKREQIPLPERRPMFVRNEGRR
jgi:5-methylcytosine-specific restriction protein A